MGLLAAALANAAFTALVALGVTVATGRTAGAATSYLSPPVQLMRSSGATGAGTGPNVLGLFEGQSDIGDVTPPGSGRYSATAGAYTLTSAGSNTWYHVDNFHYLWKKASGDVSLTASQPAAGGGVGIGDAELKVFAVNDGLIRTLASFQGDRGSFSMYGWGDANHLAFVSYQFLPTVAEESK